MGKLVVYAAMLGVFFAGGLGVSAVLLRSRMANTGQAEAADESSAVALDEVAANTQTPPDETLGAAQPNLGPAPPDAQGALPSALRGTPMSPEEIFRQAEMFKQQMEHLKRREDDIKRQATRLKIMQEDLENSKRELNGLRQEITAQVAKSEGLLQEIISQRTQLQQEQQAAEGADDPTPNNTPTPEDVAANEKKLAELFQSMSPDVAADMIRTQANDGNIELVAKLLTSIEERNAAKIIGELEPELFAEVTKYIRQLKHPAKTTTRR